VSYGWDSATAWSRPASELSAIAELIRRASGIALRPAQFSSLQAALARVAPGVDPADVLRLASDEAGGTAILTRLIDEIAVKETFFFRHERELAAIEWRMLRSAAQDAGRDVVRVWSAACATGEEPYTLAILACEAFGGTAAPVRILGSDISETALARARQARYAARSVREVAPARRDRWFERAGAELTVRRELRDLVEFRQVNLARDPIPPQGEERFDLIVCRNVLIYFDRNAVQRTLVALERALWPHGMLVIGAADRLSAGPPSASSRPRRAPVPDRKPRSSPPRRPAAPRKPAEPERERARNLDAVHAWSLEATIEKTALLIEREPLNVDAYFVLGVAQLAADDPAGAVVSLRRALFLDPEFGLAAFKLARAHEALGDRRAARRAYLRALHSLRPDDPRNAALLAQLDIADVAVACRMRLADLGGAP
jgi:chemotaxis protein methyltransferase CheR